MPAPTSRIRLSSAPAPPVQSMSAVKVMLYMVRSSSSRDTSVVALRPALSVTWYLGQATAEASEDGG